MGRNARSLSSRLPCFPGMWVTTILCLLVLAVIGSPAIAGLLWSNGCDSSSGWTSSGTGQVVFTGGTYHSGTGSIQFTNSGLRSYQEFTASSGTTAVRFWFYDANTTIGGTAPYMDVRTAGGGTTSFAGFGLNNFTGYDSTKYQIRGGDSQGSTTWHNGTVARSRGWHRIEILYDASTANHVYKWYVDRNLMYTGATFTGNATFGRIVVGNGSGSTATSDNFRMDSMAVIQSPVLVTINQATGGTVTGTFASTFSGASLTCLSGYYAAGEQITLTATPNCGYSFVQWSDGNTSNPRTYTVTSDATLSPVFATSGYPVTLTACPAGKVTVTLDGSCNTREAGSSVTIHASGVAPGYTFSMWADGSCSGTQVATTPDYTFTMPSSAVNYYAVVTPNPQTLTVYANANGSAAGGGTFVTDQSVTVTAIPDPGYCFKGWSTDAGGTTIVSKAAKYTFNMPPNNYTLYANFALQRFSVFEGFEAYALGSLDRNDSSGPNRSALMPSNPWFGPSPPNGQVKNIDNGIGPHSGTKLMTDWAGNCIDYYNIAYRVNGGNDVQGKIAVDWWFYDAIGPSNNTTGTGYPYMNDSLSLQSLKSPYMSYTADYASLPAHFADPGWDRTSGTFTTASDFNAIISLGCARDVGPGWDYTKYQARILGASGVSGQYGNYGFINLGRNRSIGWHHCRIVLGKVKTETGTCDVSFFIDDMDTALLTADSAIPYVGYNLIETQEMRTYWQGGSWSHPALWDDITITSLPTQPSLSVVPGLTNTTATATFGGSFSSTPVSYMLAIDAGEFAPATSPSVIDVSGLDDGLHTVSVKAIDEDGAESGTVSAQFVVDKTPPTTPTIIGIDVDGLNATVSFGGSTDASAFHYEIKLDDGSFEPAVSPKTFVGLSGGSHTVYVKAVDVLGQESEVASESFMLDSVPPTIANLTITPENEGDPPANNCLKGKLWVGAEVADTGGSGLASVQIKLDDGSYETMPAKDGGDPGEYEKEYTIDASWDNGTHSVTIKATDGAGNVTTASADFQVNKNEIAGIIGLQGFTSALTYRDVAFVLNGTTAKVVNLGFLNGIAAYSIVDVPDLTSISAKTAWSLRRKMSVSASDGQYVADFVGTKTVLGGDLNGDNVVNALDYSILRGSWGSGSAGDINGDGYTDNADYLIMKANWYGKGDAP